MPIQELLIQQMSELIVEINKDGLKKKIDLSQRIILLLYGYLKQLGLSDEEISDYHKENRK